MQFCAGAAPRFHDSARGPITCRDFRLFLGDGVILMQSVKIIATLETSKLRISGLSRVIILPACTGSKEMEKQTVGTAYLL